MSEIKKLNINGVEYDLAGGGTSDHTQLTNRDASNQHPMSAISGLENALDSKGTYSKPSGGIPKTDLASAVQASLDRADSALQEHQNIYELDALPTAPDDFYVPVAEAPDGDNKRLSFDSLKVKLKTYFDTLYNKVTKTSDLVNDSGFLDDTDTEEAETLAIDDVVTEDSTNLITSGAVYDVVGDIEAAINAIRGVS